MLYETAERLSNLASVRGDPQVAYFVFKLIVAAAPFSASRDGFSCRTSTCSSASVQQTRSFYPDTWLWAGKTTG